jgi:hypothetical protein
MLERLCDFIFFKATVTTTPQSKMKEYEKTLTQIFIIIHFFPIFFFQAQFFSRQQQALIK